MDVIAAAAHNVEVTGSIGMARFPKEPYPGLRSFLDHESALLCGRDEQVDEVLAHLRKTQFVAVIGGSGSGKSSLVRAGLMPRLRSYGIRQAGDFWIPMVCTPGTNATVGNDGVRETPIRRLAWKFDQLLKKQSGQEGACSRVEEVASVFRQDQGFERLVDNYGPWLRLPDGLQQGDARLLFVIDQFEELFHPTNKDRDGRLFEDARLLVERVIDHFFSPHPQVYVVLTMRSEHLNDCAGFLELPDAINKASYLVRRLDKQQLKQAIVEPAQRYLRVRQREEPDSELLPSSIVFEDDMVARLTRDVQDAAPDPDHLPLLQHVLSRTWDVACARAGAKAIPERICMGDLEAATQAVPAGEERRLNDKVNVLRESLITQAERAYRSHESDREREAIDAMLRNLAFKDPNTGLYSQQRINIDASNREHLHSLVKDGLVGSVNYLYWDEENRDRQTLKVSHESFIRGWPRFRQIIDREAERFEEFLSVLRACERWKREGRPDDQLLEGSQLRRIEEAQLRPVIADPDERRGWFRHLGFVRDGVRFHELEGDISPFVENSWQREQDLLQQQDDERAKKLLMVQQRQRARHQQLILVVALMVLTPLVCFYAFVQSPTAERIQALFLAANAFDGVQFNPRVTQGFDSDLALLGKAIEAGQMLDKGKAVDGNSVSRWALEQWGDAPGLSRQLTYYRRALAFIEPRLNGTTRSLLSGMPWPVKDVGNPGDAGVMSRATTRECSIVVPAAAGGPSGKDVAPQTMTAEVFSTGILNAMPGRPQRAILLERASSGYRLRAATLTDAPAGPTCAAGEVFWDSPPEHVDPKTVVDASLRFLLTQTGWPGSNPTVTVDELQWAFDGKFWKAFFEPPGRVTLEREVSESILATAKSNRLTAISTWAVDSGVIVSVADRRWLLASTRPVPFDMAAVEGSAKWARLTATSPSCDRLAKNIRKTEQLQQQVIVKTMVFARDGYCFDVARSLPTSGTSLEPGYQNVRVSVHVAPGDDVPDSPVAVAALHFGPQPDGNDRWFVGIDRPAHDGWLALQAGPDAAGQSLAVPWSTRALVQMGSEIAKQARTRPPAGERKDDGHPSSTQPIAPNKGQT